MEAGWSLLRRLPKTELARQSDRQFARYIQPPAADAPHA